MIHLSIPGVPVSKGSRTIGWRRDGSAYTRPAAKGESAWVDAVADMAMAYRTHHGDLPTPPYDVGLIFIMPRPKKPTYGWPVRGDIDKLERAVLDGLVRGGLLLDDRHVVEMHSRKSFAPPGGASSVLVSIAHYDDQAQEVAA